MTIGEIKIAALKLMFTNDNEDIKLETLHNLYNESNRAYSPYLINMNEVINRALDRIVQSKKLPKVTVELNDYFLSSGAVNNRFDLSSIRDLYRIDRITCESKSSYNENVPFKLEGSKTLLIKSDIKGKLTLIYYRRPRAVRDDSTDDEPINIPNEFARLIPYFIKAELYEEDEPVMADKARQFFENGLAEVDVEERHFVQNQIKVVYGI